MTPTEMRAVRTGLGATQAEIARFLRLAPKSGGQTVRAWEAGRYAPSGPIIVIYELLRDGTLKLPVNPQ